MPTVVVVLPALVRLAAGLLGSLALTASAQAAEFHAVITNFGNAPRAHASLDVSVDSAGLSGGPIDVLFNVFRADGTVLAEFAVTTNADGFASSAWAPAPNNNLFRLSGGEPAIVRARTPLGGTSATATLQQRGRASRLLVSVPPDREDDGTPVHIGRFFAVHVGDVVAQSGRRSSSRTSRAATPPSTSSLAPREQAGPEGTPTHDSGCSTLGGSIYGPRTRTPTSS